MKLVGLQFHQSGGNRQFRQAQLDDGDARFCYPGLNQAPSQVVSILTYLPEAAARPFPVWEDELDKIDHLQ
jgi:hypothetical protein